MRGGDGVRRHHRGCRLWMSSLYLLTHCRCARRVKCVARVTIEGASDVIGSSVHVTVYISARYLYEYQSVKTINQ